MPPRTNTLAEARRFLAWARADAGRELRLARHNAGLTLATTGARIGWSKTKLSRIERGMSPGVSLEDLVLIGSVVGLRPSVRFFPTGRPIRDAGQLELLGALNRRMHPRWSHRHEVPMPAAGDLRAADQVSSMEGCRVMIEAYRHFTDAQAQVRSARNKQRDLGADRLLILIEDTNANRRAVLAALPVLRPSFPITARSMMAALAGGRDPGGDGLSFCGVTRRLPRAGLRQTQPKANQGPLVPNVLHPAPPATNDTGLVRPWLRHAHRDQHRRPPPAELRHTQPTANHRPLVRQACHRAQPAASDTAFVHPWFRHAHRDERRRLAHTELRHTQPRANHGPFVRQACHQAQPAASDTALPRA